MGTSDNSLKMGACRALLCFAVVLGVCACKTSARSPQDVGSAPNGDRPALPAERVQVVESADRPTLQLIRRDGDPSPAVALSVLTKGGSREAILLTVLLKKRLEKPSRALAIRTHALGVVLASEVHGAAEATAFFHDAEHAISAKVTEEEVRTLSESAYFEAAARRAGGPSPFGQCMAELGSEGAEALQENLKRTELRARTRRFERVRAGVGAAQVGLAALGDEETLRAVAASHDRPWPSGRQLDDLWEPDEEVAVGRSAGGRQLRVALRLSDSEAALATARELERPHHPLHARLKSVSSHFSSLGASVTLRPAGACLALTVSFDSNAEGPTPERLAQAGALILEELSASVKGARPQEEKAFALLSPAGALEAVALAAWTAVRAPRTAQGQKSILEYLAPPAEIFPASELESALRATREAWDERSIPIAVRDEAGQAELWVLVASRCGLAPEPKHHAGLRALTVRSLASQFDGQRGVHLLPWISPHGVGLVAHAPPFRGELPERLARRVSRALGAALSGAALDGRAVAEARAAQLARIGTDPGVDLLTEILGGEHPSLLRPLGIQASVGTFSAADVERTRGDLAREPLQIAALTNVSAAQGGAVQKALSRWLAPARDQLEACTSAEPEPAPPQQWTLESIEDGVESGAYLGIFTPGPPELGYATAFLLNQGALTQALDHPGLAASASASFHGSRQWAALFVQIGAEHGQVEAAVHQVRGLLQSWAEKGASEEQVRQARLELARRRHASRRTPQGRLVELWLRPPPVPIDETGLDAFWRQLAADLHRLVLVTRRR